MATPDRDRKANYANRSYHLGFKIFSPLTSPGFAVHNYFSVSFPMSARIGLSGVQDYACAK